MNMLTAASPTAELVASFPALAVTAASGAPSRRLVSGVAVPYGVEGTVADGTRVVFHEGSLDAAARPPVLFGHDRGRPLGVVADAADAGDGIQASARISRTPAGDEAMTLAADGALMFSVGARPTDADYDDAGVLHVYAADWLELSLLPLGAFAGAQITEIAAAAGDATPDDPDPDGDDPDDDDERERDDPPPEVDAAAAERHPSRPRLVPVSAGARRPNPFAGLNIRGLNDLIMASRGDPRAWAQVEAALAAQGTAGQINAALVDIGLGTTDNVALAYRPAYQAELVELISWGTPLIDAIRSGDLVRGDWPTKTFTTWEKAPTVALQTAEKTAIASTAAKIGSKTADVKTWAGGNDLSQQLLDLGSPSFVEDYIRAAAIDYATKVDAYACTTLLAAATNVTTAPTDEFIAIVGKLVAALSPATTPPGGLFLAMSYNVGAGLISVPRDAGPAFWDGSVSFGAFMPSTNVGGLTAFVDPNLPASTYLLGHRQGATWYAPPGVPFRLSAVNVGLLGLDVAIYGYGALGVQYPGAFVKTTNAPGPTEAAATGRSR